MRSSCFQIFDPNLGFKRPHRSQLLLQPDAALEVLSRSAAAFRTRTVLLRPSNWLALPPLPLSGMFAVLCSLSAGLSAAVQHFRTDWMVKVYWWE